MGSLLGLIPPKVSYRCRLRELFLATVTSGLLIRDLILDVCKDALWLIKTPIQIQKNLFVLIDVSAKRYILGKIPWNLIKSAELLSPSVLVREDGGCNYFYLLGGYDG